jgi:hypothetical protein
MYIAFAADPDTEQPTVAKSFSTNVFTDNTSNDSLSVDVGFKPGLIWTKYRGSQQYYIYDNIRSKYDYLSSNDTYGNQTRTFGIEPTENGFTKFGNVWNRSGTDQIVAWTWKADDNEPTINTEGSIDSLVSANANAGFSISKWTGNGSAATIGHGLSATPEIIITKRLTGTSPWYTYNAYLNGGVNPAHYFVNLNTSAAETSNGSSGGSLFNSTPPTSTIFNIGTSLSGSGDEYIAYCFHSVSGYSKIGSYSGTAGALTVTTGFQPDFLMVKNITSAGYSWYILDSVRGGSGGYINKFLAAESNQAETEVTNGDIDVTFTSTGFQYASGMSSTDGFNKSGDTYIYMAFKIN